MKIRKKSPMFPNSSLNVSIWYRGIAEQKHEIIFIHQNNLFVFKNKHKNRKIKPVKHTYDFFTIVHG